MKKTIRQVADDFGVKSSAVYFKIRNHKSFSEILKPYISKKGNTILISPKGQEILKEAFLNETNPNELSNSAMNTSADLETSEQSNENSDAEINVSDNTLGTSESDEFAGDYLPELLDFSDFEKQFWQERFDSMFNDISRVLEELEKMEKINKIRTFSFSVAAFCVLFILLYIITLLQ